MLKLESTVFSEPSAFTAAVPAAAPLM